ncbi:aminotransferase class-III [Leadbetterella byssophila DSM 17132]|uniref:Aminotransferase class-III n=1 Tax=Leadbetterella byssophila (strain DSM 17132 / JCM 16389 / KACC 11308 / NBRC 106382 / 4M15) TaxID=649349 RepID=E4RTJ5_LEAB4|nr:aspartate aminotransferase family protein [Leadbetterella byssophila]ADQ16852.1 aminotransferase class-III [Leadbetterella byssophila DSM 17132]
MNLRQLFLQNVAQTSDSPLALEFPNAEGSFLIDVEGKKYLDLISGISVSNVGHKHPKVVKAIHEQTDKYLHQLVYGEFLQTPQILLAKALVDTHKPTHRGQKIDNVYFTNSGAEAVEGALKLAKRYTGKPEIVACRRAYHGSTQGAMSLGEHFYNQNYRPLLPGIRKMERNRWEDLDCITDQTAAVIIEPIGAECGVIVTEIEFMQELSKRCVEKGALLIMDEIQTGLGRTGKMWAYEHFGFAPDIVLSAKALGGGLPLGAFMAPQEIISVFKENPVLGHITTFGGNPLCCAAGLASLEVVQSEIDLSEVSRKGERIKSIFEGHPLVGEVRGIGLMLAATFPDFPTLKEHIDYYIGKGLITDWFLYCDNAMRISPPLNISDEEIDLLESIIKEKSLM